MMDNDSPFLEWMKDNMWREESSPGEFKWTSGIGHKIVFDDWQTVGVDEKGNHIFRHKHKKCVFVMNLN